MAASGWCIFLIFSLIFVIFGGTACVQARDATVHSTKKQHKHSDSYDTSNPVLSIADTAKKKTDVTKNRSHKFIRAIYTQTPYHHSRKHNEISSSSHLTWHSFLQSSAFNVKRSKRSVKHNAKTAARITDKNKREINKTHSKETSSSLNTGKNNALLSKAQNNSSVIPAKAKNSEVVNGSNVDDAKLTSKDKEISSNNDGAKKTEVTNKGVTPGNAASNNVSSTTLKPEKCINQTDPAELEIITKFSSQDSMWAALSLGILLFILFGVVWYSKMWRKYSEFYDTYGTGPDTGTDTSTEMAWSKYGHTTTVSLKEIIQSKKQFFHDLQMKIKHKLKNNSEQKSSSRNHRVKYSKLRILPNDIDEGSDDEDVLFKRL